MGSNRDTSSSLRPFRATVNGRAYDMRRQGETLELQDQDLDLDVEHISGSYVLLRIDGRSYPAAVEPADGGMVRVTIGGRRYDVRVQDERDLLLEKYGMAASSVDGGMELRAPMPGLVLSVAVEEGDAVELGQRVVVLEAMKMENDLSAAAKGIVKSVHVAAGDAVGKNALLLELELE